MQVKRASKSLFLVTLMLLASLSGCFGEDETVQEGVPIVFQIDYQMPEDVVLRSGEWHEFQLLGNGRAISVPTDVMLFVEVTSFQTVMLQSKGNPSMENCCSRHTSMR